MTCGTLCDYCLIYTKAQAFKTRDEMHSAGIGSDRIAYDALAAGCGLVGDWEAAETLVREMLAARDRAMSKDAAPAGVATEIDPELGSQTSKTSDAISSASSTGDNTTSGERRMYFCNFEPRIESVRDPTAVAATAVANDVGVANLT